MHNSCTEIVKHSKVKVEENRRRAVFLNPSNEPYYVTKIDNCVVKDGVRTDYLVSDEKQLSVLIELKGAGVEHACKQLFASAENHLVKPHMRPQIGFLVVCSRYPRFDTFVAKAKQHAAKSYKCGFHVVCDRGEFELSKLVKI